MFARLPTFVVVALLLAVPMGLGLVLSAPSSDTRELLSWGLTPAWSSPKQPPLMSWMGSLVMRFAWPLSVWTVALTQALNAVGLAYVYALVRLWSPRESAAAMTILLATSLYITAAPVPFALNADILQFPFWAALLFHALRAFETRQTAHFAALALAFALAFLAKYTVLLFAASLAGASVLVYRSVWRDLRLYAAGLLSLALIAPHLRAAFESGAWDHAAGTLNTGSSVAARLHALGEFVLGFVVYLAPAWVMLALLRPSWQVSSAPAARFVRASALVCLALLLGLVVAGFKYPSRYDSPFLFLAWAALASGLRLQPVAWLKPAALSFGAALLLGGGLVYGVFTGHPRQQEPLGQAAALLQAQWNQRFACGPAYVMGDFGSAYGLGPALTPPRPGVHLIEMRAVPGYDPFKREREGAIVIYRDKLNPTEITPIFPNLDLSTPQRLTLPLAHTWSGGVVNYEYVFVPPKGC